MLMTEPKKKFNVQAMFGLKPEDRPLSTIFDLCRDMNVTIQECIDQNMFAYSVMDIYAGVVTILTELSNGRQKNITKQDIAAAEVFFDNTRMYLDHFMDDDVESVAAKLYIEEALVAGEEILKIKERKFKKHEARK